MTDNESCYRALFELSADAIVLLQGDRYYDCNQAALDIFGYGSKEEFLRGTLGERLTPVQPDGENSRLKALRLLKNCLDTGKTTAAWTFRRASGEEFPGELVLIPIDYCAVRLVQAIIHDCSERQRNEEIIRAHEQYLQTILDSSPIAIMITQLDSGTIRFANRRALEFTGLTARDLGQVSARQFWVDAQERERLIEQLVREGLARGETLLKKPDGELFSTLLSCQYNQGNANEILWWMVDISEQKALLQQLQHSEKRFRELAEHVPVGIFLTDARGACVYVNKQCQRMTGLDQEQAAGTGWTAALHEDDAAAVSRAWQDFTAGGPDFAMEYRFVRPDGRITWVTSTAIAFRNDADQVTGFVGSTTDITRHKQVESELEISRDEAERANAAKSEFLSRMSHELRTPLNAVLGFAQLLQMDNKNLTPHQNEGVGHILAGGEHLLHLIEDVLDFSRIDSGRISLYPQRVSISEILQRSIALVRALAERRNITIILPDTLVADLFADPRRLQQVLVNLLSNAIKYNVMGGTVEVSVCGVSAYMTRISVQDSGSGIRPDDQERLFKPFERVTDADNTIEGTGIGLSICKKLVEMMGGQIGCDSEFGVGSTFWFDLPDATAAEVPHTFSHHENVPTRNP